MATEIEVVAPPPEKHEDISSLVPQTSAVAKRAQKRAARLQKIRDIDDDIRYKASQIASAALDAQRIDDTTPKPEKWTDAHFRCAQDARLPMKQAPTYIGLARSILESYKRQESNEKPMPTINAAVVYVDKAVFQYPTKTVNSE